MCSPPPADTCPEHEWCAEPPGHPGRHRLDLGEVRPEVPGFDVSTRVGIAAGGAPGREDPLHITFALGSVDHPSYCGARLTWRQARETARLLELAVERYGDL